MELQLHSENIKDLAVALSKAQGEMGLAVKDGKNPHFDSHYATLGSCILASKEVLSKNGLAVVQSPITHDGKLYLITSLIHSSGQWIRSETPILTDKQTAQGMGSGLSYARRYALSAIIGLADKDDDGNGASLVQGEVSNTASQQKPQVFQRSAVPSGRSTGGPGAYVLTMGKYKGATLDEAGPVEAASLLNWIQHLAPPNVRGSAKGKAEAMAVELYLKLHGKGKSVTHTVTPEEPDFSNSWPDEKDAPHEEQLPF